MERLLLQVNLGLKTPFSREIHKNEIADRHIKAKRRDKDPQKEKSILLRKLGKSKVNKSKKLQWKKMRFQPQKLLIFS